MIRTYRVVEIVLLLLLGGCADASSTEESDAATHSAPDKSTPEDNTTAMAESDGVAHSMGGEDDTDGALPETESALPSSDSTDQPGATNEPTPDTENGAAGGGSSDDTGSDGTGSNAASADDSSSDDPNPPQPSTEASSDSPATAGSETPDGGVSVEARGANVFDAERVHVVSLTIAAEDLASLDEHSDTRVPATFEFDGVVLGEVGVRGKGQTSFQPVSGKPGFSVKFNEFVAGQRLDGLKKLTLNNTTQDPTWCNETLTYETYRRAGLPAPRIAFAVLTLNGEPKGIYSIGEVVNEQFLSRHYGKDMNEGNLYEGPWDFSDSVDAADLKDADEENRSRDDLRELQAIVQSEPDDGFAERLATRLDVDQFLLGYAIDAVTVAWDGYAYDAWNYYLYDYPGDNRFLFLPAGANWPYFRDAADAAPTVDPRVLMSLWGGGKDPASFLAGARVQQIPSLDARFEAFVEEVTYSAFDVPAMHADFDRIGAVLHSVAAPDAATESDLETFDSHVQLAYDFVENRKAYLVEQFPR